jgi:hypothetical protein
MANTVGMQAMYAGIDQAETVRRAMIKRRDQMLQENKFHEAVLDSHAIWWLSAIVDGRLIDKPEGE